MDQSNSETPKGFSPAYELMDISTAEKLMEDLYVGISRKNVFTRSEPHTINISKRIGVGESCYWAGLGANKVQLWAGSTAQAKQRAVEHFRPKKSQKDLVWVRLA